jgi:DNA replication protein DnaC
MQSVGALLGDLGGRLVMQTGSCAVHGDADALVLAGREWACPQCLELSMKSSTRALWLAERTASLIPNAMIPARYVDKRFVAETPKQKIVKQTVASFRDFILSEKKWAALIMVGVTGTGKTLLACEIAQALVLKASLSARYITAQGMVSEIQATYGRDGKSEEGEIMRFAQYDVLILDEIDAVRPKDNTALLLTEIINRRYNDNKPVIVISNQPFENLAKFVGDRVFSRLHENAFICAFEWQDYRRAAGLAA